MACLPLCAPCSAGDTLVLTPAGRLDAIAWPGRTRDYRIEVSDDLLRWSPAARPNPSNLSDPVLVPHEDAEARFYRGVEATRKAPAGFAPSADGLVVTVGPGVIYDDADTPRAFAGGSVVVTPNASHWIGLNPSTGRWHAFHRAIDSGCLFVASAVSDATHVTVTPLPLAWAPGAIAVSQARLKAGGDPLRIGLFGDSLSAGSGSGYLWWQLLTDPGLAGFGFALATNATVTNFALGGTTAEYTLAVVASPAVAQTPLDLAFVEVGVNGGRYSDPATEGIVRILKSRGVEVVLVTGNSQILPPKDHSPIGVVMATIAGAYGCAVADTFSYVLELNERGTNTYYDAIHQVQAGWNAWAEAAAGVLAPIRRRAVAPAAPTDPAVSWDPGEAGRRFTSEVFAPAAEAAGDGTFSAASELAPTTLPFLWGAGTRVVRLLSPGQSVTFHAPPWVACALIVNRGTGAESFSGSLEVLDCAGGVAARFPCSFVDSNFGGGFLLSEPSLIGVAESGAFLPLDPPCAIGAPAGSAGGSVRFTVDTGLAGLAGLAFYVR